MNDRQIDNIKVRLYREFYEANRLLHKRSLFEYYMKQDEYVTKKLREELSELERRSQDEKTKIK